MPTETFTGQGSKIKDNWCKSSCIHFYWIMQLQEQLKQQEERIKQLETKK